MLQAKMTDRQKQFHFSSKECGLTKVYKVLLSLIKLLRNLDL